VRIPLSRPDISRDVERTALSTIREAFRTGRLSRGPAVAAFETKFRRYLGVKHALAVSSGTAALHLALLAHGIGQGDTVITTPFTFVSTSNAILYVRAKPRFVDIDPHTYNIDPNSLKEVVNRKTKALIVVHTFGLPCEMKPIVDLCEDYHILLIEDACEALGATYNGRKVGTFATSCFSFYPNKVVTTAEGGMVCTNDDQVMLLTDSLRNQGRRNDNWLEHPYVGYNYRLSEVHAAIGIPQLRSVDHLNAIRENKARTYSEALRQYALVRSPPHVTGRTWFVYVVEVDNRDRIGKALNNAGIECKPYFPPVHLQAPYKLLGFKRGDYPVCECVSRRVLALPFFTGISKSQINYVVAAVGKLLEKSGSQAN
jgi:perosamine synthetase